ncbi:SpaH/EbpB family LPXTG-anchored major pilin [Enterococcus diestrammenae]|uniref:SpaH/EbpB family LPXTG-anchored major pilin n=1 Tax=Enterococcus diestrammenae TaxID=1155073 RepID=UPI0022E16260|nr:SpaH/EbpB family LPXTG-anchored major pilin [Enterococcus diestrammenae]
MRFIKNILGLIVACFIVIPFVIGGGSYAEGTAPKETVDVTIHKRVYDTEPGDGYPKQNTGLEMTDFGGAPLDGAGFTIYDATDTYYTELEGGGTPESAKAAALGMVLSEATLVQEEHFTDSVDEAGSTTFTGLLMKDTAGRYKIYLIVETTTPTTPTIVKKSEPILLGLPVMKTVEGQEKINTDIHLYPKNVSGKDAKTFVNVTDFAKATINGKEHRNVTTADTFNYQLTLSVPADIAKATSYVVKDRPTDGLVYDTGTVKVEVGDTELASPANYTLVTTNTGGGFDIVFNTDPESESNIIRTLGGKTLTITYSMKLSDDIVPDTLVNNHATVEVNGTQTSDMTTEEIFTGGFRFVKKDAYTTEGLVGAEFVVSDTNGSKFAEFALVDGDYVFRSWATTKTTATKITSGAGGAFAIKGLLYGKYVLHETATSDNTKYLLPTEGFPFTIGEGTFGTTDIHEVKNVPKGFLPSTGGKGIYGFLLVGAMMVGAAILWNRKVAKGKVKV